MEIEIRSASEFYEAKAAVRRWRAKQAFELGRVSRRNRAPATANPYHDERLRAFWLDGWNEGTPEKCIK